MINISYRHFPNVSLPPPIDWRQNPFDSKNWVHHFLSLRWLYDHDNATKLWVLEDFLAWLDNDSEARSYVSGRKRDHTSAIRLGVLVDCLQDELDEPTSQRVRREIDETITELIDTSTYKTGHNHGLLIDEALLRTAARLPDAISPDRLRRVLLRLSDQLRALFDDEGFTREHSISYQEYNLLTLQRIDALLSGFDPSFVAPIRGRINAIREATPRLLGNALRRNNQYIPFGDSFRTPKESALKHVYGTDKPLELLRQYARDQSSFVAPEAGFGFFRNRDWHFGITSSNNVGSHKQADELSVFVEYRGFVAIDDPGYTDALDDLKDTAKKREAHSTIRLYDGQDEVSCETLRRPNARWVEEFGKDGLEGFVARAELQNGGFLWRLIAHMEPHGILIVDFANPGCTDSLETIHRFVLGTRELATTARPYSVRTGARPSISCLNGASIDTSGYMEVVGDRSDMSEMRSWVEWRGRTGQPMAFLVAPHTRSEHPITVGLDGNEDIVIGEIHGRVWRLAADTCAAISEG